VKFDIVCQSASKHVVLLLQIAIICEWMCVRSEK